MSPLSSAAVTTTAPTWADAVGGDLLLLLGYPNETGALSASVGRILNHAEATRAVAILAALGDPEGSIPYDAEAEMIVEGEALVGMSGGPAVDEEGRLVGILVRATEVHDGVQYLRVVRMSYVVSRLAAGLEGLDFRDLQAIKGFLEPGTEHTPTRQATECCGALAHFARHARQACFEHLVVVATLLACGGAQH